MLERNDQRVVILGATSGDTGSAALEGCRHSERVEIYILHPYQRVSDVQRKQMTTVPGKNVFNLAIEGNLMIVKGSSRRLLLINHSCPMTKAS